MSDDATLDEFAESVDENTGDQTPQQRHLPEVGELPPDWNLVTVEEIADSIVGGGTPTKSNEEYWGGEIPWASVKDLNGVRLAETEDYITESGVESSATNLVPADSIIISTRMTVGEPFLNEVDMAINQDMKAIIPDTAQTNSLFAVYSLWDKDPYLKSLGRGTTVDGITTRDLYSTHLGLPPFSEQRKIATVLRTVDQAIQKSEDVIKQTERVKQGVRQDILTRGLRDENGLRSSPEQAPAKYEDDRNWTIPHAWELEKLSEVCSLQVGYAFKSDWYRDSGEVRVLRGANVGYGKPDWSETKYLEPERVDEYQEYRLNLGDIIIGMDRPYTGSGFKISRLSERDIPSLLVQRVGRYQPDDIHRDYLSVVLSDWRYQKQVLRRAQGMDIPHISKTDILSPKIPVPPQQEQERIAEIFTNMRDRVESEKNYQKKLQRLKRGLIQDLLSGEVRTTDADIDVPEEVAKYG